MLKNLTSKTMLAGLSIAGVFMLALAAVLKNPDQWELALAASVAALTGINQVFGAKPKDEQ